MSRPPGLGPTRDDLWIDRRGERLRRPCEAEKQERAAQVQEVAGWNPDLKCAWEEVEGKVQTLPRQMVRTVKLLQELKALDEAAGDFAAGPPHAKKWPK